MASDHPSPNHAPLANRTRRDARAACSALVALALSVAAATAFAEPSAAEKETARSLMKQGSAELSRGNPKGALTYFQAADSIMKVPTTGLAVARAQAASGMLLEARDTALTVSRQPDSVANTEPLRRAREEAATFALELEQRIPALVIVIEGVPETTERRIEVDGATLPNAALTLPWKVNPGTHRITASAHGYDARTADVVVAERESKRVAFPLTQSGAPALASPTQPRWDTPRRSSVSPLVYAGFGTAAVGAAVGIVAGIVTLSKAGSIEDQCEGTRCPAALRDDIDAGETWGMVSNIGFIGAGVGATVGVVGLVLSRKGSARETSLPVKPSIGLGRVELRGTF